MKKVKKSSIKNKTTKMISEGKAVAELAKSVFASIFPGKYKGNEKLAWEDAYAIARNRLKNIPKKTSKAKILTKNKKSLKRYKVRDIWVATT